MQKSKKEKLIEKILKDRDVRREVTTRDFAWFFPVYFHKRFEYETPPFHEEIFRILQDVRIPLFVLTAFRGSAKSTIVTVAYTLWAVFGVQEKKFVILVGQTEAKARQYLMNIRRQLENNKLLRDDLGPIDEERDQWGATALVIRKLDAKIMAVSVGQSIRGSLHNEHRPDLVILDDVEDTESVKTHEGRDKLFDWFTAEVLPVGGKRTRFVVVGNLLHEDSLMRRLQKRIEDNPSLGVYREYPIINEHGTSLWPSKYPTPEAVEAERQKMMDPIAWAREYLLKIVPTGDQVVQREWIHYYENDDFPSYTFDKYSWTKVGIDLAISLKETADYTAMVTGSMFGKYGDAKLYIHPFPVNVRMNFPTALDKAIEIAKTSVSGKRLELLVEEVGYQTAFTEALRNSWVNAKGVKVGALDKRSRLSLVSHLIKNGVILFPKMGCEQLIEQIVGFGVEKHDDLMDAFVILATYALDNLRPHTFGTIQKFDRI